MKTWAELGVEWAVLVELALNVAQKVDDGMIGNNIESLLEMGASSLGVGGLVEIWVDTEGRTEAIVATSRFAEGQRTQGLGWEW